MIGERRQLIEIIDDLDSAQTDKTKVQRINPIKNTLRKVIITNVRVVRLFSPKSKPTDCAYRGKSVDSVSKKLCYQLLFKTN